MITSNASNVTIRKQNTMLGEQFRAKYTLTFKIDDEPEQTEQNECSILFSSVPMLVFNKGKSLTPILHPERFGKYDTTAERRKYIIRFVTDNDIS